MTLNGIIENHIINKRPIFIGGCPRSGTTMLGAMLGDAARCVTTPESPFKQKIPFRLGVDWFKGIDTTKLMDMLLKDFEFRQWKIPTHNSQLPSAFKIDDYRNLLFGLVDSYAKKFNKLDWNVWIDHTPNNFSDALLLLDIFPNAKFIHIVRDPRAIAASIIPLHFGPNTAKDAAVYWGRKLSDALAFELVFPKKCLRVKYEDLVLQPEKSLQIICDFSGIRFVPGMIFGKGFKVPEYTKIKHGLVGSEPKTERIDTWERELADWQIYQIENSLHDLMGMMGYTKIGRKLHPPNATQSIKTLMKKIISSFINKIRQRVQRRRYGKHKRFY